MIIIIIGHDNHHHYQVSEDEQLADLEEVREILSCPGVRALLQVIMMSNEDDEYDHDHDDAGDHDGDDDEIDDVDCGLRA